MYVKHIVLDGFKSYKERTDIGPFDPHFNAITGLNGSGKSNILDAICFVLGLSSLQLVRAQNLGELVYKGGSSGITRAAASIVFDNRDKSPGKCPPRYEKYDEIIVSRTVEATGTCKYFLNSITSTKKEVVELFESVQLNISSPNFVIMQGKITKVIAMSPRQILGMVEETVGGNVYQGKRDKCEQELKNKERCIASTQEVIDGSIYPEYKKQKDARDRLVEFQDIEQRRLKVSKYVCLLSYKTTKETLERHQGELAKLCEKEQNDEVQIEDYKTEIEDNKKRQEQMKKENTQKFKGKIDSAEKDLSVEKKSYLKAEAEVNSVKLNVEDCKKKLAESEEAKAKEEKAMENYKKKSASTVGEFETVKTEIANAEAQLTKAHEQEQALKMGNIVDEQGNTCDARQELMKIEDEIHKIQPDFQVGDEQYKEDQQKFRALEQQLKRTPSDDQVEKDYVTKKNKVEQLKAEAVRKNINPDDSTHDIVKQINQKKQESNGFENEKRNLMNRHYNLSLNYNKNAVDTSKVYGCMYELMKFHGTEEWGAALEVAVSNILGHIVVHDDHTGKALLKANLNRRTYIHALSTFQSSNRRKIDQQTLDRQLGPGKAVPATDLIEADGRIGQIVQHYVGGKVLCDTMDTARFVAFKMDFVAITKQGDVIEPGGIMHGGLRRNLGETLPAAQTLSTACNELKRLFQEIQELERRHGIAKVNEGFMKTLEIAKRDLQNAEETRKLTKSSMMQQEVTALKDKLQADAVQLKEWKAQLDQLEKGRKAWKTKVDQLDGLREKNKKENSALISKWEKALEAAKKKYDAKKKHFENIDVDIKSHEAMIADCTAEINAAKAELADCEKALETAIAAFKITEKKLQDKQAVYDDAVAESQQWNAEYNQLEERIKILNDKITKIDVAKIKRNNIKEKLEASVKHADSEIKAMTSQHKTVNFESEKVPDGEAKPLNELRHELDKLNQTHQKLRERIDPDAAERCDSTKSLMVDSESRMKKLEQNRDELQSAINRLDQHKLDRVTEAFNKINEEFNKMMGTLLPDSSAKLVPVKADDMNQGLHIHVQLGGVWKESLGELSGGQKSLVALALTLSLCMYNPAPFYVLDEIDSALDLNHTQNIGVLIKRRFVGTQFLCVSLKDGMYSNCNVLFQVQFLNGKSEVKRCVRQSSKKKGEETEAVNTNKTGTKRLRQIV